MKTTLRARAFHWSLVVLALISLDYWIANWRGTGSASLVIVSALLVLTVLAIQEPLSFTPRHRVSMVPAVTFATMLLCPMPVALIVVATGQAIGGMLLRLRRRRSLRGRSWRAVDVLFQTSRLTLATAAGGFAYYLFVPHLTPAPQGVLANIWALPLAAVVMNLVDTVTEAVMTGLQVRQNPARVWLGNRNNEALQPIALYLIGLLGALTSAHYQWALLVVLASGGLLYMAVRRTIGKVLFEQTISAVQAMADTVDMRDHYTFEHSKRVTEYAVRVAQRLELAEDEVELIRMAARVHDLGKIGIPDQVLLKEGGLTEEEWATMQQHPKYGYDILGKFPEYRRGRDLVLYHHERFDGRGYPHGLDGSQIPIGAQIIAVADSLDAMTTDRPYRKALYIEQALAEFSKGKGSQWNPEVVGALEGLVEELGSGLLSARRPARIGLLNRDLAAEPEQEAVVRQLSERLQIERSAIESVPAAVAAAMLAQLEGLHGAVQRLERQLTVDELTGALRREAAEVALEKEISRARRTPGGTMAVGLIDIQGLRALNEAAGEAAGDRLLQALADALQAGLRSYDQIARWSDDEFLVMVSDCDERDATRLLSQLATAFELRTGSAVTVGLAVLRGDDELKDLIGRAERERRKALRPGLVQTRRSMRIIPSGRVSADS